MAKIAAIKPQLSLFENKACSECGVEVPNNQVTCESCAEAWVQKYIVNGLKNGNTEGNNS